MKSLQLSKPHLIVMVGLPGAGKTFFANHFAETFHAPLVSWQSIRGELFNDPTYSKDEDSIIERMASQQLEELLKTGATIIHEGDSLVYTHRQTLARQAAAQGYEVLFVWVQTDPATAKSRASRQRQISSEDFANHSRRFTALKPTEPFVVISGKHTYASQLKIVLRRLSQHHQQQVEQVHSTRQDSQARPGRTITIR
jgi:predicted kinase